MEHAQSSPSYERKGVVNRKNEFLLAMSIFVAMAVIGTAFGLWMVGMFNAKPMSAPPTVEGKAADRQAPPPASARPDAAGEPNASKQAEQGVAR